jgi:hypothetical protein
MDPFVVEVLGVAFRWLVTSLGAYLVAHHMLSPDQEVTFRDHALTYLADHAVMWGPLLGGLVLGIWTKYRSRIKFLTALEARQGTSEPEVKQTIKNGMGASL